nr:hypothetical protein [Legionella tunisiensis]
MIVLIGLGYGYYWYKNQPQPQLVTAAITAPKITPLTEEETLVPDNLTIDFGFKEVQDNFVTQSVAPLQLIGKEVPEGIELSPAMPGKWRWESDSRLVFTPDQDWPAGQTYDIHFVKHAFAATAKMERFDYSFSTEPFQAKITELKFYQDPVDAKTRQVIATIHFNFPVDPTSFERKTSLMLEAMKKDQLDLGAQKYKFTVNYDKFKRTAYLHSENLSLPEVSRYLLLTIDKGVKSATDSAETNETVVQKSFNS